MHYPTDRIVYTTVFITQFVEHRLEREIVHGSTMRGWGGRESELEFENSSMFIFWIGGGGGVCVEGGGVFYSHILRQLKWNSGIT